MPENELLNEVDLLGGKVARLISRFQELEQRIRELQFENQTLKEQLQEVSERLGDMDDIHKTQTLTHLLTQGKEKAEVKAQIERIVRDIDRCMGLLSQPDLG